MPMFRQGSVGTVSTLAVPPLAGSRAGTTNPAGGLSDAITATNVKTGTLVVYAGVVAASTGVVTAKVQSSATSGGTYADISGAAIAGFGPSDDNTIQTVDFEVPADKPYLKVVLTQSQATDLSCAMINLRGPMRV
jgi:hypothetical protein